MSVLERSNPLPLYYQLKEVLRQQIRAGHLAPHTAIPSEPELVARYHVSRATVRQALNELVNEGLLYRQHGKGTFVCEPRVQQTQSELSSFSQDIRRRGKHPGGLILQLFLSGSPKFGDLLLQAIGLGDLGVAFLGFLVFAGATEVRFIQLFIQFIDTIQVFLVGIHALIELVLGRLLGFLQPLLRVLGFVVTRQHLGHINGANLHFSLYLGNCAKAKNGGNARSHYEWGLIHIIYTNSGSGHSGLNETPVNQFRSKLVAYTELEAS
jgi:DNA-binding transcriptional regulator YhcF (GntR family)